MSLLTLFARNEHQLLPGYDGDAISQLIAVDRDATIAEAVDELEISRTTARPTTDVLVDVRANPALSSQLVNFPFFSAPNVSRN